MSGTVTITIVNDDTGHTEVRRLGPADYAVLYGPELELMESYRVPVAGTVTVRLRPRRREALPWKPSPRRRL